MSKINIMALRHSAFYSPLLLTIAGGFLKQEGLEPSYEVATPERTVEASISDGGVHVAQSAVATGFAYLERGETPPVVHFAQINERDGFFLAAREPQADFKWSDLRGKQVLVDHFFQPLAMFKYALHREGVDINDIDIIDAGDVAAIDAAFREGRGDYVHQQGPAPQQLEHEGLGHVVAAIGDAVGPVAFSSLCASREWLETDMAKAFTRAYRKARQFAIDSEAKELAELEADFFPGVDRQVLASTIAVYQKLGCWVPDPAISRDAYERLLDVFENNGGISERWPYDNLVVKLP